MKRWRFTLENGETFRFRNCFAIFPFSPAVVEYMFHKRPHSGIPILPLNREDK